MKRSIPGIFLAIFLLSAFAPVALGADLDKDHLEGWITQIDYTKSNFRMLDARGFQRRVVTKSGTIGDYKIGDKVRVEIDPDYQRADSIEILH